MLVHIPVLPVFSVKENHVDPFVIFSVKMWFLHLSNFLVVFNKKGPYYRFFIYENNDLYNIKRHL